MIEFYQYLSKTIEFIDGKPRYKAILNSYSRYKIGGIAGSLDRKGYRRIKCNVKGVSKSIAAHRLCYFITTGSMPFDQIDHINGIKDDNSPENLRSCNNSQNRRNAGVCKVNTSGYRGVATASRGSGKWCASLVVNKKTHWLGTFTCKHEAARVWNTAARMYHGHEFCFTNTIDHMNDNGGI